MRDHCVAPICWRTTIVIRVILVSGCRGKCFCRYGDCDVDLFTDETWLQTFMSLVSCGRNRWKIQTRVGWVAGRYSQGSKGLVVHYEWRSLVRAAQRLGKSDCGGSTKPSLMRSILSRRWIVHYRTKWGRYGATSPRRCDLLSCRSQGKYWLVILQRVYWDWCFPFWRALLPNDLVSQRVVMKVWLLILMLPREERDMLRNTWLDHDWLLQWLPLLPYS